MLTFIRTLFFLMILILVQTSCRKGCIDDNALNYQPEAKADKGCIYPETFNLTSIGINYHPSKDAEGNDWDSLDNPDKFITIFNHETNQILYTTEAEEFLPVNWTVEPVLSADTESTTLRFELYDQDDNTAVLMDQLVLRLKDLTGRANASSTDSFYPESDIIEGKNGSGFSMAIIWSE